MTRTVGIVLFPDVEELDFVGPLEALGAMALYLASLLTDRQTAQNVQQMMDYYPRPTSLEEVHA